MPASTSLVLATAALLISAQAAVVYKPVSEALVVSTPASIDEATGLKPRANFKGVGCDKIMLSNTETDQAVTGLINQCRGKTQSIFSYDGDSVVFYCQWHPGPQCSIDSANHAFDMITDQCGLYGVSNVSLFRSSCHSPVPCLSCLVHSFSCQNPIIRAFRRPFTDSILFQGGSYSDKSEKDRTYSYGYTNWRVHGEYRSAANELIWKEARLTRAVRLL